MLSTITNSVKYLWTNIILTRALRISLFMVLALFVAGVMIADEALAVGWFNENWLYRKVITVQSSQVIGGPHVDFPMLVRLTSDADLAANVAQADGGDIIFTDAPTSGPITRLPHERVSYNNTTGALLVWVNVNSINNGTVIYMYYGNSTGGLSYGLSETEKEAVWTNNYVGVWHLDEQSPNPHLDSTSNDYDSYSISVAAQGQTTISKIDGADEFDTSGQQVLIDDPGVNSPLDAVGNTSLTLSAWVRPSSFGLFAPFSQSGILAKSYIFRLDGDNGGCAGDSMLVGTRTFTWDGIWGSCGTMNVDTWYHVVSVYEVVPGINNDLSILYINGSLDASGVNVVGTDRTGTDDTNDFCISGGLTGCGDPRTWDGFIDEVRVQSTNRSAGWIQTEFNNQDHPTSSPYFLIVSEEVSIPTMTEWGMILFMILAGLAAVYFFRRRERVL